MDINLAEQTLLKRIRGTRSQNQINRLMGFNHNKISRWETGRCAMKWTDFVSLTKSCRVDLKQAFVNLFNYSGDINSGRDIFIHMKGLMSAKELSAKTGFSIYMISRWKTGKVAPRLNDILLCIHVCTDLLCEFLTAIAKFDDIESFFPEYPKKVLENQVSSQFPFVSAALQCFLLESYKKLPKHKPGFIAKKIGITIEEESELIEQCVHIGLIEMKNQIYEVLPLWVDLRLNFDTYNKIRIYWLQRAEKFLASSAKRKGGYSFLAYSVSEKTQEEIKSTYLSFFYKIMDLVDNDDEPLDKVMVFNAQFLDLERISKN